jgi:hypothetical protein
MIIRTPSPALRRRIEAIGDGPLIARDIVPGETRVLRWSGSELSEPEQRRVAGLLAADDAEPFAKTDRA